jgi:hypothetical protein
MRHYLCGYFIFDFIAVVPVIVSQTIMIHILGNSPTVLGETHWFKLLYLTKFLRFAQIPRVKHQFERMFTLLNRHYMQHTLTIQNTKLAFFTFT